MLLTYSRYNRISDIVEFFSQSVKMPRIYCAYAATLSAQDLIESLQNNVLSATFAKLNSTNYSALLSLADIFNIIKKKNQQI